MKTYRKTLTSSFEDIWNNGFSILDTKKVQKSIKVNQICSYLCKTCTNTTHRAQRERGRLHKKFKRPRPQDFSDTPPRLLPKTKHKNKEMILQTFKYILMYL